MLALNNADKLKYFTTQPLYVPDNQGGDNFKSYIMKRS